VASQDYHIEVRLPWHVIPSQSHCIETVSQCMSSGTGTGTVYGVRVWTADPDAPAINVAIAAGPCPPN